MRTVSVETSIDRKEAEQFIEQIIAVEHPFLALFRLSRKLSPDCDDLRTQAVEHEKKYLYYVLAHRSIIGLDGLPKATIGTTQDDMEGRMVEEAMESFSLTPYFFQLGYGKAKER